MFFAASVSAQEPPRVKAGFASDSVLIGDRFELVVEISKDVMQVVEFPSFDNGTIGEKMEIVSESAVDTLSHDGRTMVLGKRYTLTCFEAGDYRMEPYPALYLDKNVVDTVWAGDSLRIVVNTFDIDTLSQQIYDIKLPMNTPLRFGEFGGYLLWGILALAGIAAAVYFLRRYYLRRKGAAPTVRISDESPHVTAIKRLEQLHAMKLWQSGKLKQYYTGLTDILREYIESRYGIPAMEMTSSEIMASLEGYLDKAHCAKLSEVLLAADPVKFAKYVPDAEQNEKAYNSAYYFVEDTKPLPGVPEAQEGEGKL